MKRNPQDATLRNVRAQAKRLKALELRVTTLGRTFALAYRRWTDAMNRWERAMRLDTRKRRAR